MATALFNDIIFGPVQSRRLGTSLGINLLPTNRKLCSFNCVYCECGWTEKMGERGSLPTRSLVKTELRKQLEQMRSEGNPPDVITFAGNGEPTMHPDFAGVIDDTIALRNEWAPQSKIAVLSNATRIHKAEVFEALLKIEDNIQKLDSAIEETVQIMDSPIGRYSIEETIENLRKFEGKVIVQTMLLKGEVDGKTFDNTTEEEMTALVEAIGRIKPSQVMLYSISRDTPAEKLTKVERQELDVLAKRLEAIGLEVQVSG